MSATTETRDPSSEAKAGEVEQVGSVPESQAYRMVANPDATIMGFKVNRDEQGHPLIEDNFGRHIRKHHARFTGVEAMEGEQRQASFLIDGPGLIMRGVHRAHGALGSHKEPTYNVMITHRPQPES